MIERALVVLGATAFALPGLAQEHRAAGSVLIYSDDDAVTVISPALDGHADLHPVGVDAHYQVDVVSAASVDLVTSASPRGFSEVRHQASGNLEVDLGRGTRVGAGYGASVEPDFVGHGLSAGARWELFRRHTAMQVGYAFQLASLGRVRDPSFSRSRTGHELALTWSQVLDRASVADVSASVMADGGALENPYRYVRIYDGGSAQHATAVAESAPDRRLGVSGMGRFRRRLHPRVFALAEAQLHGDSWAVLSATGKLQGRLAVVPDRLLLTLEGRGYWQRAASFYRRRYETFPRIPEHRTADKELGPMWTALGGIDLEWSPAVTFASALRFGIGFDLYHMRYLDHPALSGRTAMIGTFDVELEP